ncbi:MAG TPA: hypothetical protein VMU80_16885 [Bryobacteraceae bacterium]|nr:hypothetical protein [Bryobacteraceae bacterium]
MMLSVYASGGRLYQFVNLIPMTVEAQQAVRIDIAMQAGEATDRQDVISETSSLGQVVEQKLANDVPLNSPRPHLRSRSDCDIVIDTWGHSPGHEGTEACCWLQLSGS